jgi:integrase
MVLLAAWCGLRFGELAELRRVDVDGGVVHVSRAVVRLPGTLEVGTPKSAAGARTVAMPPHIRPEVETHLDAMEDKRPGALLFPAHRGGHLAASTLNRHWNAARKAAGRPDLRWHDLRHTGATRAAQAGATTADLMARLGHSTIGAAMLYQHAAQDRDAQIAAAMSRMAQT